MTPSCNHTQTTTADWFTGYWPLLHQREVREKNKGSSVRFCTEMLPCHSSQIWSPSFLLFWLLHQSHWKLLEATDTSWFTNTLKPFCFVESTTTKWSNCCTSGDVFVSKDEFLCYAATHADVHLGQQLSSGLTPSVILWQQGHLNHGDQNGTVSFSLKVEYMQETEHHKRESLTCPRVGPRGMMVALLMGIASLVK